MFIGLAAQSTPATEMIPMPDSPDESHLERIRSLEEAAAFADRHAEQLSQQIVEVWARIDALANRLGHMESRLTEMHQSIADRQQASGPTGDTGASSEVHHDADDRGGNDHQLRADRPPHWDGKH